MVWADALPLQTLGSDENGWAGYTVRTVIAASVLQASGSKVRLTMQGPGSEKSTIVALYIGHAASMGDAYDFDGNQVPVTYGGLSSWVINAGATIVSDEITFALDKTKPLILSMYIEDTSFDTLRYGTIANIGSYYKGTPGTSEAATTNVSGYSAYSSLFVVKRIEALLPNNPWYYYQQQMAGGFQQQMGGGLWE